MSEKRTVSSARGIRRGDAVAVDQALQTGNLIRVKDPKMLTLVASPANQTAFKVLREDAETPKGETKMSPPIVRRTRRSEVSPVMRLSFPADSTQESVDTALVNYGLSGYKVEQVEGVFIATRGDLKSIATEGTVEIKLNEQGLTATVARVDAGASAAGEKNQVALVSIEFDAAKFTLDDVQRWSTEKCVDGAVQEPQNPDDCYVVRRSEVSENDETRRMVLEDGVTAVITRSDVMSVPAGFIAVVSETAYGNWGWGQLDFMASMGDKAFSEQMREAIYSLEDILRNIVIYSALPLDVRKELANRALAQFGDYIGTVMDSLPRQLLVSVTRSANPQPEKSMTQKTDGGTPTKTDEVNAATATPTTAEAPLTRADVTAMIAEAVTKAVTAVRSESAPAATTVAAVEAKPAEVAALTRSDLAAAFADAVKPLVERMDKVEGQTVVRSAPEATPAAKEEVKDVFRGAIPGIAGRGK